MAAGYVGEILEMGLQSEIHRKKKVNLGKPKVNPGKPLGNLSESTVMMICYCQGTGGSLRSQWELQESILVAHGLTAL